MLTLLALVLFLLLAYWYSYIRRYPRGPFPLPLLGNILSIVPEQVEWQLVEWKKKYGPVFTIWIPFPMVIFGSHEAIKAHFIKNGEAFAGRGYNFWTEITCGGRLGLVLNENSMYKEQRRFALHVLRDLGVGKDIMEQTTLELARRSIEKFCATNGEPIDLRIGILPAVMNVINKLVFGEIREHDDKEMIWFKEKQDEAFSYFLEPLKA